MSEEEILDEIKKCDHDDKKIFGQNEKAKKGWTFSVVFLGVVIALILFLSFFPIHSENRDILVGIIGVFTGNISAMIMIASGRDPAEIEELKENLSKANADRQALISRLRDSQIQLQLLRDQISELQTAMIEKLSIFHGQDIIKTKTEDSVVLNKHVNEWLDKEG